MPISPADAEDLAAAVRVLYDDAEVAIVEKMRRALAQGIASPLWAEIKLRSIGDLRQAVERITDALQQDVDGKVAEALAEAYGRGRQAAVAELGALDEGRRAQARRVLPNAPAVDRLAASYAADARPVYARVTRVVVDTYRAIVTRVSAGPLLGTETRLQASQRALSKFAGRGITGFTDTAGRNWDLASYAEMAVRSVTARAAIEGHVDALTDLGVGLVVVSDSPLECERCRPWEGEVLALSGPPGPRTVIADHAVQPGGLRGLVQRRTVPVHVVGTLLEARAADLFHPNCFPGEVLVTAPSGVRAADSRWYEGELVVIHTAGGDELPVTPNHPVLTPEGWVPAGSLQVGQRVLRHRPDVERVGGVSPGDQEVPAPIGEVFNALRKSSPVAPMHVPGAAEQFHGDGFGSDVEVVLADGLLRDGGDAEFVKALGDGALLGGGVGLGALLAEGSTFEVLGGAGHAAHGCVCARDLGGALLGGHGRPLAGLGLAAADLGTALGHPAADAGLADAEGGRQLALALSGSVTVDEVVHLGRRQFSGHVYNLQSSDGWYVAGGLVVHNCRHSLSAYLPGVTTRPQAPPHPHGATYEDTQQQRYYERQVCAWKRRSAAAMDEPTRLRANARVRDYQARIRALTREKGLPRRRQREQLGTAR